MDHTEFAAYQKAAVRNTIHVSEVAGPDRTLVHGVNSFGHVVHTYKRHGVLHVVTYQRGGRFVSHESGERVEVAQMRPDVRAVPSLTDAVVATLMRERGAELMFSAFDGDERGLGGRLAGMTVEEVETLSQVAAASSYVS